MASENFQFHYVYTKTGSISGQMVLRQTEDAINDLGDYIYDATLVATEALTKANQAIDTANTASSNASTALSTANSALSQVQTLTVTVNSWNDRITTAEGNAQNAVTTANSALSAANQAVETANAANTKSDQAISTANSATQTATSAQNAATQAVGTANQAVEAANQAISIANSAVTDTDAVRAEIDQALETVNAAVTNATTQAQNAAGSASQSESSAALAREWAIKMDGLVVDEDYSSKYYAQQAASSASAASGSAKAAAGSATAASKSETNAAQSATSAASSATAASGSATTAQNAATAAKTAQTAAEAARDEAVEAASANTTAVLYSAQKLTTAQQTQARKNVGAVGTSGNETVAGTKTFSNSISVSANPLIRSTNWSGVKISDTSHSASQNKMLAVVNDEDGKRFAGIEVTAGASGDRNIHISLRARDDSTWVTPWKVAELADGSIEESITGKVIADSFSGDLSGNADTATKLKTARTISLSGDATGSVSIDGSANATLNLTIANGSVTNGMLAARSVTFSKVNSGDVATQAEAEAGTANNSFMTPLRVKQAIAQALKQDLPKASATQLGGVKITGDDGITINGSGEIAVDFSQMPTDKFEDLVKSIRVPIWLKGGKNFYVNGSAGSDTLDEGRGESSGKPFRTIKKCINYIADNYNLSSYTAYVNIADGVYDEDISLPLYNSTTGSIQISGNSENKNAVIIRRISSNSAVTYSIRHLTVQRTSPFPNFGGSVLISAGRVNFLNVEIDTTLVPETSAGFAGLVCSSNAFCNISGSSSISNPGIFIRTNATTKCVNGIQATSGGRINFNGNLNLVGDAPENFVCAVADNLSSIRFVSSGLPYPVGTPTVINEGNKLGKRYNVRTNAIIDTSGQGPELFPGTIAGTTGSGGQYV